MNDERVAMLFRYLLDPAQQKLYFCLFSLLRNNVSKSVYINLRYAVVMTFYVKLLKVYAIYSFGV